jgi:hypothetical protein
MQHPPPITVHIGKIGVGGGGQLSIWDFRGGGAIVHLIPKFYTCMKSNNLFWLSHSMAIIFAEPLSPLEDKPNLANKKCTEFLNKHVLPLDDDVDVTGTPRPRGTCCWGVPVDTLPGLSSLGSLAASIPSNAATSFSIAHTAKVPVPLSTFHLTDYRQTSFRGQPLAAQIFAWQVIVKITNVRGTFRR